MLLELYITILVLNFIVFAIAFFRKDVWFWSISLVLSAFLIFASYNIVQSVAVVNSTTQVGGALQYTYAFIDNSVKDTALSWLAIGMFLVGLALFLNDLFQSFKENKLGERKE
jgi:hypothetical protein